MTQLNSLPIARIVTTLSPIAILRAAGSANVLFQMGVWSPIMRPAYWTKKYCFDWMFRLPSWLCGSRGIRLQPLWMQCVRRWSIDVCYLSRSWSRKLMSLLYDFKNSSPLNDTVKWLPSNCSMRPVPIIKSMYLAVRVSSLHLWASCVFLGRDSCWSTARIWAQMPIFVLLCNSLSESTGTAIKLD